MESTWFLMLHLKKMEQRKRKIMKVEEAVVVLEKRKLKQEEALHLQWILQTHPLAQSSFLSFSFLFHHQHLSSSSLAPHTTAPSSLHSSPLLSPQKISLKPSSHH